MASCTFPGLEISQITAEIDCCTLTFTADDGRPLYIFDLNTTIAIAPTTDDDMLIKDQFSYLRISGFDLATTGLTIEEINESAHNCRCGFGFNPPNEAPPSGDTCEDVGSVGTITDWDSIRT